MKPALSASLAGIIFGVGLCISGMTDPKNVLAFLDVTGHWSPKLGGVMFGAIAIHAAWLRWGTRGRSSQPNIARGVPSSLPPARIDRALVAGAALFGIGWGLAGYCPGPSLVALGTGALAPVVFVAAMVAGMLLAGPVKRLFADRAQLGVVEPDSSLSPGAAAE